MAIVKLGATVVGIRGTVGGLVFTANRSGPYVRAWSRGANPRAPLQSAERGRLAAIPELWRALTPALQTAWDVFGLLPAQELFNRLGESFFGSGYLWFTKCNTRLLNMTRATITAVPVIARPAAPTITSLELPYLDAQGAFIVYPSGEFPASTDLVLELSQAISIGRQVSPTATKTLVQTQSPGDTEEAFLLPYLNRFGIGNSTLKGFTRVYRQTTEGIRSSAGTADFISTDSPAYVATADDYNGTTMYSLRGADLTGNADSKRLLFSIWFRKDGSDGVTQSFYTSSGSRVLVVLQADNTCRILLRRSDGTFLYDAATATTFLASATWHNVIWSVDLATGRNQLAVDGVLETPVVATAPVDDTIDFTVVNHAFAATVTGTQLFDGCLSEWYFNNSDTIDLEAQNGLRPFISPLGSPMDLGPLGDFPTGTQAIIYVPSGDASANLGSGGNFTNVVAPVACSTAP